MDDISLAEALAAFDLYNDMVELDGHHLFAKLVQAHGLLSEVADQLSMQNADPEMLGMIKAAEHLTDFISVSFQAFIPHDQTVSS